MDKLIKLFSIIVKGLTGFGVEKEFIYNFQEYDGSEEDNTIKDTNVVEYEFVNMGTSMCIINGMRIYPPSAGFGTFNRIRLPILINEMDVTVYKYEFVQFPDFYLVQIPQAFGPAGQIIVPVTLPENLVPIPPEVVLYNRLLVITKVKANKRTSKAS